MSAIVTRSKPCSVKSRSPAYMRSRRTWAFFRSRSPDPISVILQHLALCVIWHPMPDYSALRLPLSERLPLVTYTNLVWPVAETVWMSSQVECLTGYRLDQWVGRPGFFESILHPDDRATVLAEAHAS